MNNNFTSRALAASLLAVACVAGAGCGHGAAKQRPPKTKSHAGAPTSAATRPADPAAQSPVERPLFDRLGGTAGVTKVVEDFVALAAADPKVNFTRKGQPSAWEPTPQNVATIKKRLVEFIATATGGDLTYTGKDMVSAHKGMNVTEAEFDALAADLKAALDKHDVPAREQAELLAVVNRTRSAIVIDPELKRPATPPATADAPNPGDAPKVEPAPAAGATPKPPMRAEAPAPFVPQAVTSDETELDEETPTKPALEELNK